MYLVYCISYYFQTYETLKVNKIMSELYFKYIFQRYDTVYHETKNAIWKSIFWATIVQKNQVGTSDFHILSNIVQNIYWNLYCCLYKMYTSYIRGTNLIFCIIIALNILLQIVLSVLWYTVSYLGNMHLKDTSDIVLFTFKVSYLWKQKRLL